MIRFGILRAGSGWQCACGRWEGHVASASRAASGSCVPRSSLAWPLAKASNALWVGQDLEPSLKGPLEVRKMNNEEAVASSAPAMCLGEFELAVCVLAKISGGSGRRECDAPQRADRPSMGSYQEGQAPCHMHNVGRSAFVLCHRFCFPSPSACHSQGVVPASTSEAIMLFFCYPRPFAGRDVDGSHAVGWNVWLGGADMIKVQIGK